MPSSAFDAKASTWDSPERVARSSAWAHKLRQSVQLAAHTHLIEFGCGTGLMSLALAPYVDQITALDSSAGMLAVLEEKCRAQQIANVSARLFDIEQDILPSMRCDLFLSCTALHHVRSPQRYAQVARQLLDKGGCAVVIDLDREDGSFHRNPEGVYHHGFDRTELEAIFRAEGFAQVRFETLDIVRKVGREEVESEYPIFIMSACI